MGDNNSNFYRNNLIALFILLVGMGSIAFYSPKIVKEAVTKAGFDVSNMLTKIYALMKSRPIISTLLIMILVGTVILATVGRYGPSKFEIGEE